MTDSPSCRRWLTTGEVARVFRVSKTQVRRLVTEGRLPCTDRTGSGLRLFQWTAVSRALELRAKDAARTRPQRLTAIRPRMLQVHDPRQGRLRLFEAKGTGT